jgi:hypothetical protein
MTITCHRAVKAPIPFYRITLGQKGNLRPKTNQSDSNGLLDGKLDDAHVSALLEPRPIIPNGLLLPSHAPSHPHVGKAEAKKVSNAEVTQEKSVPSSGREKMHGQQNEHASDNANA